MRDAKRDIPEQAQTLRPGYPVSRLLLPVACLLFSASCFCLLASCAGAANETASPAPSASVVQIAAESAGSGECGVELLAARDLTSLLQGALEVDVLAGYWHADKPGRKPLRVLKTHVVKQAPTLSMFGAPVEYVDAGGGANAAPYLIFKKVELRGAEASVEIAYPAEGIAAFLDFKMSGDGSWALRSKSVKER